MSDTPTVPPRLKVIRFQQRTPAPAPAAIPVHPLHPHIDDCAVRLKQLALDNPAACKRILALAVALVSDYDRVSQGLPVNLV